jgi:hypothetical protein
MVDPILIAGMGLSLFAVMTAFAGCCTFSGKRLERFLNELDPGRIL